MSIHLPDVMEFCESLGIEFTLDAEGVLAIAFPAKWKLLHPFLDKHVDGFANRLKFRAQQKRMQCKGGPWDGRRHHKCPGNPITEREAPQRWVTYVVLEDWSGSFVGYFTSQKKARWAADRHYHRSLRANK